MTELQYAAPDVPAEWADSRETHIAVATAIHAISGPGRSAEKIWAAPTREEWDDVCMAVENYVDFGLFAAENDNRYAWGEAVVVLQRHQQEHIISAVLGEDSEVIELSFDPVRPESQVFYRYPDINEDWQSCPFQSADLRHLSDKAACAKVHNWVG